MTNLDIQKLEQDCIRLQNLVSDLLALNIRGHSLADRRQFSDAGRDLLKRAGLWDNGPCDSREGVETAR